MSDDFVSNGGSATSGTENENENEPTMSAGIVEPLAPSAMPASSGAAEPHDLDPWFDKWFPEDSGGVNKPIKYLSQEWHYVRDAYEDLKAELKRIEDFRSV